ncbi:MAG: CoA transferase [Acidobacteriota bacterium]|nr:CoA transferase [Acidobacteriota bacterium]
MSTGTEAAAGLPLSDIRVVDLTIARAGPTAVRQLADWGAEVIRIEPPVAGEDVTGSARHGSDFQNLHRNKRCLSLNLKTDEGKRIFSELARRTDVIVENFRTGVKTRLGIDYDSVRALNPRIVYGSISGFGQTGPYRDRPGVDQIAQGMGGLMSVTGLPGQGPVRVGTAISDLAAGLYLAFGIMTALHERERSGEGQWVHTSLLEAQLGMLDFQVARYLIEGDVAGQAGNHHPTVAPMGVFPTADGHMNVAASGRRMFGELCDSIGRPDLVSDPDYATVPLRSRNREPLIAEISRHTREKPTAHWIEDLNRRGIPCGPINDIEQALDDPQVRHLGIATPVEHPELGEIRVVGQPVHLERTPQRMRSAAPERGEHTREVLVELGYDDDAIDELTEGGVV